MAIGFFSSRGNGLQSDHLNPVFTARLMNLVAAAERATGQQAQMLDLYRPPERQAQYYANYTQRPITWNGKTYDPQAGGGLAAQPGRSRHGIGEAADFKRGPVLDWMHSHAGDFGLEFLRGHSGKIDPGHVQLSRAAPVTPEEATSVMGRLGYSGPDAVAQFQRDHGLTADGIIGPQTVAAMREVPSQPIDPGDTGSAFAYADQPASNAQVGEAPFSAVIAQGAGQPPSQMGFASPPPADLVTPSAQAFAQSMTHLNDVQPAAEPLSGRISRGFGQAADWLGQGAKPIKLPEAGFGEKFAASMPSFMQPGSYKAGQYIRNFAPVVSGAADLGAQGLGTIARFGEAASKVPGIVMPMLGGNEFKSSGFPQSAADPWDSMAKGTTPTASKALGYAPTEENKLPTNNPVHVDPKLKFDSGWGGMAQANIQAKPITGETFTGGFDRAKPVGAMEFGMNDPLAPEAPLNAPRIAHQIGLGGGIADNATSFVERSTHPQTTSPAFQQQSAALAQAIAGRNNSLSLSGQGMGYIASPNGATRQTSWNTYSSPYGDSVQTWRGSNGQMVSGYTDRNGNTYGTWT